MSKSFFRSAMIAALIAAGATGAIAKGPSTQAQRDDLVQARQQLSSRAESTKGARRAVLEQEKRQVESLINDLEAGRPVDPAEVERSLKEAERRDW